MPEESREAQDPLQGVHVLLVADDPDSRGLLKTVLEYAGALVSLAYSGKGALRALEAMRPDVMLCDLVDGLECEWLAARLRERRRDMRPPCVLLGPQQGRDERRRALDAGFGEALAKPVDPWELCRVLAHHARGSAGC
jgi:DNA-binding response OmpR family regulator